MVVLSLYYVSFKLAGIAQLVEYKLPKLGVAGSNPVARSSPAGRDRLGGPVEGAASLKSSQSAGKPASPIEGAGLEEGARDRLALTGGVE